VEKTKEKRNESDKLSINIIAMFTYVGFAISLVFPSLRFTCWFIPIIMYFINYSKKAVRFHSCQAFILGVIANTLNSLVTLIITNLVLVQFYNPFDWAGYAKMNSYLLISNIVISVIFLLILIVPFIKLSKNERYAIPIIGNLAGTLDKSIHKG